MKLLLFLSILITVGCSTLDEDPGANSKDQILGTWALTSHSFLSETEEYDTIPLIYKITDSQIITYDNREGEFSTNDSKVPDTTLYKWANGTITFNSRELKAERYGSELTLKEVGNVGGITGSVSTFLPYYGPLPPSSWIRSAESPAE